MSESVKKIIKEGLRIKEGPKREHIYKPCKSQIYTDAGYNLPISLGDLLKTISVKEREIGR